MAEEKDPKDPKDGDDGARRKGVPAMVLLLVGAALGGAGVTLMAPQPVEPRHPQEPRIELYEHPDRMEFTFNPRVDRGYKSATASFIFVYRAHRKDVERQRRPGDEGEQVEGQEEELPPVLAAIRTHWNRARSRAYEILSAQTPAALNSPEGKRHIKRLLIEELTAAFFPDGIAQVHDIYWEKIFVQ